LELLGGLLAPCRNGQICLMDPRSGDKLAEPFQPPLKPGGVARWQEPAPVGDSQFVVADGLHKLYLVGLRSSPKRDLVAVAELDVTEPITSPVAVLGDVAYAVDESNMLLAVKLPKLNLEQQWPLGGRCIWGPKAVGDRVLLATDDQQLHCLDANRKVVWQVATAHGALAGAPLAVAEGYILASKEGILWRVSGATGEEAAKYDIGRALGTGAVLLGDRLLVGGHDGTLYQVPQF
jgi:outer membrane protein assembly factor BamB